MGTAAPADAATIVRWMLGKPLQFDPGTQFQYSNFGYTVLGRIIEKITGTNYEAFIQSVVAEAGIRRMRISGSRLVEKLPGEVTYWAGVCATHLATGGTMGPCRAPGPS